MKKNVTFEHVDVRVRWKVINQKVDELKKGLSITLALVIKPHLTTLEMIVFTKWRTSRLNLWRIWPFMLPKVICQFIL
jgi:hypothetical protein